MTLKKKFSYLGTALFIVGIIAFILSYSSTFRQRDDSLEVLKTELVDRIKSELKTSTDIIAEEIGRQIHGLPEEASIDIIREILKDIRFYTNDSGYFFVYTLEGICVALPPKPEKHGEDLSGLVDEDGVYFVKELAKAATNGGDFVSYRFPKPGSETALPKMSYSRFIPGSKLWIGTGVYIDEVDQKVTQTKTTLNGSANNTIITLAVAGAAVSVVVSVAGLFIFNMLKALNRTTGFMQDIAQGEGDLTIEMDASSKDELGQMGRGFNAFVSKLRGTIIEIKSNVTEVDNSSNEMKATSDSLAMSAEQMGSRANVSAEISKNLSTTILGLSQTTDSVSQDVNNVASAVEELNATITEVARSCSKESDITNAANSKAQAMKTSISDLKAASEEIEQVFEIIGSIAAQTNLLALNATIEAASAGEAGKGFAVVANEVKELAKQSADATDRIKSQVDRLQSSSGHAISGIEGITETVFEIDEIAASIAAAVEEQSSATAEISGLTQRVANSITSLSNDAEQISASSNEVSENTNATAELSQQTAAGATESNTTAIKLSEVAGDLRRIISQFKVE